jgi:hypothetical protein
MATHARVSSIDAITQFRASLCNFGVDATNALAGLDLQLRRVFEWLEQQGDFWVREVRRCEELLFRAKAELLQRKSMGTGGKGPGYTEQELAVRKALAQLQHAQEKVENCRHWARILPREVMECEAPARVLGGLLESDLRKGLAVLDQKTAALEAYLAVALPASSAPTAAPIAESKGDAG